jgi:ParB family chromosome partitioning protein
MNETELTVPKKTEAPPTDGAGGGTAPTTETKKTESKKAEAKPDPKNGSKAAAKPAPKPKKPKAKAKAKPTPTEDAVTHLALSEIVVEKGRNPRQNYDRDALKKLSISLKHMGMLQPMVVRTKPDDKKYYLVAGERRYRAAKLIKMTTVPCIIKELMTDAQVTYAQYAENAHREDLNPIEYAQSIANFIGQEVEMTDKRSGKTQVVQVNAKIAAEVYDLTQGSVSQYLALLKLPKQMQEAVRNGKMTFAQARELCSPKISDKERDAIFKDIMSGDAKRASDVKAAAEKTRAKKAAKTDGKKKRGRPAQTSDEAPSVRQNLDTALERLRAVKLTSRTKPELREGLAMAYERHERAKSEEKKQFHKGFAAGLEWAGGIREKI